MSWAENYLEMLAIDVSVVLPIGDSVVKCVLELVWADDFQTKNQICNVSFLFFFAKDKIMSENQRITKRTAWKPFSSATYCTEMIVPSGASYEYEPLCTIISAASSSPVLLPSACNRGTNTFLWYPFVCCFIWFPVSKL